MSSIKGKKPSLDGMGDLDDLLVGSSMGLGGGAGLGALLDDTHVQVDDPIGEIDASDLTNEQLVDKEISATLAAFKARAQKEQERFLIATDSEYWFAVCFQTRAQKEHFLRETKLLQAGDKYIDGALLAKRMGITLPPADVPYNVSARPDAKLAAMVKS